MKKVALFLLCCNFFAPAVAEQLLSEDGMARAAELRDMALKDSDAYSIIESLTVEVGPRLAGTEGDRRAVEWAMKKLQKLGFDRVYTEQIDIPRWERGIAHAEVTSPYPQPLVISALGGSVGTSEAGVNGELVAFETLADLKKAKQGSLKGKVAFINQVMDRSKTASGYGPVYANRAFGAIEAAKKGALAIVIRSVGTDSDRFAHTGSMRYQDDVKKIPAAAMSAPDADLIAAMMKRGKPVKIHLHMTPKKLESGHSFNVIAEVTGREKPEEIVIISAHLDSWDLGTGALDDGAGVGIVVETARLIKALPERPRRTIRVILFGAEEIGLVGSKQYMERHRSEMKNIIVGTESDLGARKVWRFDTFFPESAMGKADQLMQLLAPLGIIRGHNEARGGPDTGLLKKEGVPVVTLFQDGSDYFDFHHTPNDTLDKIDPEEVKQNVAAWVAFTYYAAEMPGTFGRIPLPEDR